MGFKYSLTTVEGEDTLEIFVLEIFFFSESPTMLYIGRM